MVEDFTECYLKYVDDVTKLAASCPPAHHNPLIEPLLLLDVPFAERFSQYFPYKFGNHEFQDLLEEQYRDFQIELEFDAPLKPHKIYCLDFSESEAELLKHQ